MEIAEGLACLLQSIKLAGKRIQFIIQSTFNTKTFYYLTQKHHTIKEFNVATVWSEWESSFCVDPGRIDMLILGRGDQWSTFCSLHEKVITFLPVLIPGGQEIDNQHGEDWQHFTVHMNWPSLIIDAGGWPENYAAPLSLAKHGIVTSSIKKM